MLQKESSTGKKGEKDVSPCMLCPRMCGADRTKMPPAGYCGMGNTMRVARIAPHFWEEPCISGTRGSGTIFFTGCHEGCVYCQNREISRVRGTLGPAKSSTERTHPDAEAFPERVKPQSVACPENDHLPGRDISPRALADACLRLQEEGVHNINLVTPTHFVPEIVKTLETAKRDGLRIPVVYNTGGYERVETLRMLDGLIDIYLTDFQHASEEKALRYANAPGYADTAMCALKEMLRQTGAARFEKGLDAAAYNALCEASETEEDYTLPVMERGVIVRHLVLPGSEEDTRAVLRLIRENTDETERRGFYLSIMNQYTPMLSAREAARFPELTRRVSDEDYEAIIEDTMRLGFENVFFQYGDTASESFVPVWDGGVL